MILPIAIGAIGDAYSELEDYDKAISQYIKAANVSDNIFLTPIYLQKAGELLEEQEKPAQALGHYERIKIDFPDSNEGRNIDKYISRVRLKSAK